MTHDCRVFSSYTTSGDHQTLVVGNDTTCKIAGNGTALLTPAEGKTITLEKVLYVPGMIKNLISLSRLLETDIYEVKFDKTGCRLLSSAGHAQIAKAELQDRKSHEPFDQLMSRPNQ